MVTICIVLKFVLASQTSFGLTIDIEKITNIYNIKSVQLDLYEILSECIVTFI